MKQLNTELNISLLRALVVLAISAITINAQFIQWTKTYPGPGHDGGEAMVITNDGSVVIAGFKSPNNLKDILLMKTDASGNEVWSRTYSFGLNDWGRDMRQTSDGGFIIAGMTEVSPQIHDPILVKTDSEGNLLWYRQYDYGFGRDDRAHAVWQTSDGGYIIAGQTAIQHGSFINYDFYVIKTDMNGNVQWKKIFNREEEGGDVALAVQQLNDGGYIIGGFTQSSNWASYVIRTDGSGNIVWSNIYSGSWQSECYDIKAEPDGGFILTGTESSFETDTDVLIIKLDGSGNLLWKKIYGSEDAEQGESIIRLPDGGYIIAGMSAHGAGSYDLYVLRTNSTGDSLWSRTIGGEFDDRAFAVASSQLGSYYVTGWIYEPGLSDVHLIKLTESLTGNIGNNSVPTSMALLQNYPNPFNPSTTIRFDLVREQNVNLSVYDLTGRLVEKILDKSMNAGTHEVSWDATNYSGGVYFYTLKTGEFKLTKKMILVK